MCSSSLLQRLEVSILIKSNAMAVISLRAKSTKLARDMELSGHFPRRFPRALLSKMEPRLTQADRIYR